MGTIFVRRQAGDVDRGHPERGVEGGEGVCGEYCGGSWQSRTVVRDSRAGRLYFVLDHCCDLRNRLLRAK